MPCAKCNVQRQHTPTEPIDYVHGTHAMCNDTRTCAHSRAERSSGVRLVCCGLLCHAPRQWHDHHTHAEAHRETEKMSATYPRLCAAHCLTFPCWPVAPCCPCSPAETTQRHTDIRIHRGNSKEQNTQSAQHIVHRERQTHIMNGRSVTFVSLA